MSPLFFAGFVHCMRCGRDVRDPEDLTWCAKCSNILHASCRRPLSKCGRCGSRRGHAQGEQRGAHRGHQRQRGYASHARTRRKLRTEVTTPTTMPAITTLAITKRVAVRPTPGSS